MKESFGMPQTSKSQEGVMDTITKVRIPEEERQKMQEEKRRSPNVILVTRGGKEQEISAKEVLATMEKDGVSITVDGVSAEHIYSAHLAPDAPPGSKFEGRIKDLKTLLDIVKGKFDFNKIQQSLTQGSGPLEEKKFAGTIDIGEKMSTGVATLDEAVEKLGVSGEEVEEYKKCIKEIVAVNKEGNEEKKKALIESYNNAHSEGKIYLSQRFPNAPITPFFDGDDIATTELMIVVIDGKLITTMPGHHREKLPFSPSGVWEYASPEEKERLIGKFGGEEEAKKKIGEDFEINAKDWTGAGFIKRRQ